MTSKAVIFALLLLCPPGIFAAATDVDPELTTAVTEKRAVTAKSYMAVTANPLATRAATRILAQGGSAVDAAIAAQMVLGLVEPQSSGIGGGAFMVRYDAKSRSITSFDGRETAPAAATPDMFLNEDGTPMKFFQALVGGRSVGVPGLLAMLEMTHERYGKLPWAALFQPAIELAEAGFAVSPRLAGMLAAEFFPGLRPFAPTRAYFYPDEKALKAGAPLKNPDYAHTLKVIAEKGAGAFYRGELAEALVRTVRGAPVNPGRITLADMAAYRPKERRPVCAPYLTYTVCGMGPPSSGGLTLLQILVMADSYTMSGMANSDLDTQHRFSQLSRLAYADRDKYIADPDFVDVPSAAMLDPDYLRQRAKLAASKQDIGAVGAGALPKATAQAEGEVPEFPSTSHLSIVDARGNAVSMTTTIEMGFGSGLMVNGFLLNNQLTDFSLVPERDGKPVANRVEAGKRPRSSMSPTIVMDKDHRLKLLIGSPGGSRIIDYTAQTVLAVLAGGADIQTAVSLPHLTNRNDYTALEAGTPLAAQAPWFERRGHTVRIIDLNSGLHGIDVSGGVLTGGADPRREGEAAGK